MDAGFLNFHKEEDFSSYLLDPEEDTESYDDGINDRWRLEHLDYERELNGDMGLIPMPLSTNDNLLSTSPPNKEDYTKIMNEWNQLVGIDVVDDDLHIKEEGFDITKYVDDDEDNKKISIKQELVTTEEIVGNDDMDLETAENGRIFTTQPKFGGKRIDMARGRYLLDESSESSSSDEDEDIAVDVETVETETSHPVLQAGDLDSLLEQFEASETTNLELQQQTPLADISLSIEVEQIALVSPIKSPQRKMATPTTSSANRKKLDFRETKHKHILDALPAELIDRIRQSSKRKAVPVIEPIAPKRRATNNSVVKVSPSSHKMALLKAIHLDHDYCTHAPPPSIGVGTQANAKDSGFSSCEEDDRAVVRTQPTVKSSDGKLMVSLLKTNTIRKKLNLEEYKQRLVNRASPAPLNDDDENARRLKHTEMLMQMAQDHLKQGREPLLLPILPMQGDVDVLDLDPTIQIKQEPPENPPKIEKLLDEVVVAVKQEAIKPRNIQMKTLVSMGTNTEESWAYLEQILQNTRIKISPNSLISSIVDHLPRPAANVISGTKMAEHGEDKTIAFVDLHAPRKPTASVGVQTMHSTSVSWRRRRRSSCSDSDSGSSRSSSASSSSRGRSRSRSRTPSPIRRRRQEKLKEVEERRVIYVGKIADDATKEELRRRFVRFGPVTNVSVHFRRHADNYGFVTFLHKEDAYQAIERGNNESDLQQYDLSFGGRRMFCQTSYADLDDVHDEMEDYWLPNHPIFDVVEADEPDDSFDTLLRKAQAKLRKRQL